MRWWRTFAAAVVAGGLLAGCTTHGAGPISDTDLHTALDFSEFTVYWAGPTVDDVPLTAADNLDDFSSSAGFTMYYGDCGGRGTLHASGCTLPLRITTALYSPHSDVSFGPQHWIAVHGVPAVVYNRSRNMEIYTDRQSIDIAADTPARAQAAAQALTPFNRDVTENFPAFPQPYFRPGVSQEDLDAQAAAAIGPTGATGATSNISPPPALEPTPIPKP